MQHNATDNDIQFSRLETRFGDLNVLHFLLQHGAACSRTQSPLLSLTTAPLDSNLPQ